MFSNFVLASDQTLARQPADCEIVCPLKVGCDRRILWNKKKKESEWKPPYVFYSPSYKVTGTEWSQLSSSCIATVGFRGLIDAHQ